MATLLGSLLISLGLESGQFKSGLKDAEKELRRTEARIRKSGEGLANLGRNMALGITLPLVALGVAAVKGAKEQAAAVAQVEAALRSMGNVSGKTAAELAKTADALEMRSLFDADVILTKVTANLLTFGNVANEQFDRAQQAAIDMATRMGSDPQSAAIMLGKALNDPIKGITALTRVGVQFTDAQKKQIKAFAETGQAAKAQNVILAEVERQFRGAAQAAADTSPLRQAEVAWNQAMDKIGEAVLPLLPVIANGIRDIAVAFNSLSPVVLQSVLAVGALAAVLGPLVFVFGTLRAAMAPVLAMIATTATTATAAGVATTGFSASLALLRVRLVALIASLGPYGVAIAGLSALIYILTSRTEELTAAQKAKENQVARTAEADRVASDAALKLANANAEQRKQIIASMQASRARAAQALQTAKALIAEAKAALAVARTSAQAEVLRSTRNTTGAGSGYDPTLAALGRKGRIVDPAQAKLDKAERLYAEGLGQLDGIDRALAAAAAPVNLPSVTGDTKDKKAPKGRKEASGRSAAEIEQQFQDELANYAQQTLSARQRLAMSAEESAELELRGVELARVRTIESINADKDYSKAQKQRLVDAVENLAEFERAGIEFQKQLTLERDATELAQISFDSQRDQLSNQFDLADTQADRKRIALEILELEQRYQRSKLQAVIDSETAGEAEKERAQAMLASLAAIEAGDRARVSRSNETQLEAFLRQGNRSPEQLGEDVTGVGLDGLNRLSDGLANVVADINSVNGAFKGMRDVFLGAIRDMIAALARLAIKRAIAGLVGAITGGGGFTGDGASGTSGGMDLRGFAKGTDFAPGGIALVGERGPEIVNLPRGSQVIPNHELRNIGSGRPSDGGGNTFVWNVKANDASSFNRSSRQMQNDARRRLGT